MLRTLSLALLAGLAVPKEQGAAEAVLLVAADPPGPPALGAGAGPWRSPVLPTLPAWLLVPNDGVQPTPLELARYQASGGNRSHLWLWSTVAQREAFNMYWSPLARASMLSGTDPALDALRLRQWAQLAPNLASSPFALLDLLTCGVLSNARFLAHLVAMVRAYRCSASEAARFLLFHALTAAPLSLLAAALALGSLRRGALALLALASLPLLLAAGPLQFGALADAQLVAAAIGVGALAAVLR